MEDVRKDLKVHCTTDYSLFGEMLGNRGVDIQRVLKIRESIATKYIPCPIVVNEKMEVVDGQGRLKALTELRLPVYYVVVVGATIEDCIRMNITSTPWNTVDYIYSGRDLGNENYIKLANLLDRYELPNKMKKSYKIPVLLCIAAAEGSVAGGSTYHKNNYLENGLFEFKVDEKTAMDECDYISSLYKIVPNYGTAAKILLFCKRCPEIDEVRMRSQITTYQKNRKRFPAYNSTDECVLSFEALYNYHISKNNKVDFRALYLDYVESYGGTAGKGWTTKRKTK